MDVTLFLAKSFGLYLVIISFIMIVNREGFMKMARDIYQCPGVLGASAIFTLILGILAVVAHNVWIMGWPVIVTLLAWITFLKGVARTWKPSWGQSALSFFDKKAVLYSIALLNLLIGCFLIYKGFGLDIL